MKPSITKYLVFISLFTAAFVMSQSAEALARPKHTSHRGGSRANFSFNFSPRFSSPRPYYYRRAPIGGVSVYVGGLRYFYSAGTYYEETPLGYVIVPNPQIVTVPVATTQVVATQAAPATQSEQPEKTVVVTVPNPNGSYIPVSLQKYSDKYVGPNGEVYSDYPTIEQLKAMYAVPSASVSKQNT